MKVPLYLAALLFATLALGAADDVTDDTPPKAKEGKSVATPHELPGAETHIYREGTPEPMRLFVFKPKGWSASDHRPALIHFYGGGFTHGLPTQAAGWARDAAKLGLVGIAADYRVKERFGTDGTACVADARAAVHWLQVHAAELGLDPAKVVVSGSSAGGHLAIWTAITPTPPGCDPAEAPLQKPAALILMSASADTSPTGRGPERFGRDPLAYSPTQNLDAKMPPALIFHGDEDKTVPYAYAVALNKKLTASGNVTEFYTMKGGGHGFTLPEWKEKAPKIIRAFLSAQNLLPQ